MGRSRRNRNNYTYGTVKVLRRVKRYPVDELLAQLPQDKTHAVLEGHRVEVNNLRIQCFRRCGVTCVSCGLESSFFALEYVRSKSFEGWGINLYGLQEDGKETPFTKDHTKPLSRGGDDALENLQTMCWPCNQRKGSKWEPSAN